MVNEVKKTPALRLFFKRQGDDLARGRPFAWIRLNGFPEHRRPEAGRVY